MRLLPNLIAALAALVLPLCSPVSGASVPGDAYDHIKNGYIPEGIRWLEIGFFFIIPDQWTRIVTTYNNFSDPVVFLSLPNLAGETSSQGTSMSLRVRNAKLTYIDHDTKNYTFEAKSLNANDSYCTRVNELYTPAELKLNASSIGWLVVERGMFNVSHKAFIIQTDNINRTNVNDSTDPVNQFKSFAPNGICNMGQNCRLNPSSTYLTLAQLQTTRYDRFLLLRALGTGRRFVVYVLLPHDSLDLASFLIPSPGEDYAWILFQEGLEVTCVENLVLETYLQKVTYLQTTVNYKNLFTLAPAVFGMVQTYIGRDSLGLRAFNIDVSSSSFITQEDKCTDAETQHTTEEDAALLIIGRTASGTTVCGATFNDNQPTSFPTEAPTLQPSASPTADPTSAPSEAPTAAPTVAPSAAPTETPNSCPTAAPSEAPSAAPSAHPSAAPSASPSADPSASPTAAPSAEPTADPSAAPSAAPSVAPSSEPSISPSAAPSAGPTAAPTSRPSPAPSIKPTSRPVTRAPTYGGFEWCVWITLYDTFGDGWGQDVALRVWSDGPNATDTYLYYLCPNDFGVGMGGANGTITRTADGGPFEFCVFDYESLHIDMVPLNPPVKETWEMYWTVEHFIKPEANNTDNAPPHTLFVGDYDTNMTASGFAVDVWEPVDYYNQTCKRCKHPPKAGPKGGPGAGKGPGDGKGVGTGGSGAGAGTGGTGGDGKGPKDGPKFTAARDLRNSTAGTKGDTDGDSSHGDSGPGNSIGGGKPKPKPKPHWPFPITLFDTTGTGFFNSSEAWTLVPYYNAQGGVEWYDTRQLPAVLTGPEYVISTIDRLHDLRRNTICGDLLKEDCEERLPDAKYIFRVGGALSKWDTQNNTFWHFCGKHGTAMEELEFKLIKGKCFPGKKITAHEKCYGANLATFEGLLTVSGVSSASLSEFDTALLESNIAESMSAALPGVQGNVALDSWELSGSDLVVMFSVTFDPLQYAVDAYHYGELENLAASMATSASAYTTSGSFLTFMQTSLMDLPLGAEDVLSSSTGVTISNIKYRNTGVTFAKAPPAVEGATLSAASSPASSAPVLASFQRSMLLIGAVLSGLVIVGYASIQGVKQIQAMRYRGSELLPIESVRDTETNIIDVSDREMVPNWN